MSELIACAWSSAGRILSMLRSVFIRRWRRSATDLSDAPSRVEVTLRIAHAGVEAELPAAAALLRRRM
eukprot:6213125-Pleurochrysis_carterae.AAC.1